jgi:SNF2 family DNA or RNA helicase
MPTPFPTQLSGATFLARRRAALLADEPRVGKTGTAIIAADHVAAEKILIITTVSGRAVWKRGVADWSMLPHRTQIMRSGDKLDGRASAVVVAWPSIGNPQVRAELIRRKWDLVISDEDHYAKNFEAKRTQALYGSLIDDGARLAEKGSIVHHAERVWTLTGTPFPNSLFDTYPRLRALAPERLAADPAREWPDVTKQTAFMDRYTVSYPKRLGRGPWARTITVIKGGKRKNADELRGRLEGFMLRRTQQDVGIRAPIYDTFPLAISDKVRREIDANADAAEVLAAAEYGDTRQLEMALGPLRRLTGEIKARAVVEALHEEFECGLDKIVLMAWHHEPMRILRDELKQFGVVGLDGTTSSKARQEAEERFRDDPNTRVFIGQIQAAGEAIDLSAAASLLFVETSFSPKDMKQASLRITNHTQKRQAFVRVGVLEGSIDEALQTILLRKWSSIREVLAA